MNLTEKVEALRKAKLSMQVIAPVVSKSIPPIISARKNALFLGTPDDKAYLPHLKSMFNGYTTYVCLDPIELLSHLDMYCNGKPGGISVIVSTNTKILQKLLELQGNFKSKPSLNNYAGSVFEHNGREIVFIDPLAQLMTVSYGSFITRRNISKVVSPELWAESTEFSWKLLESGSDFEAAYQELGDAYAIAADIETFKNPLSIRCIGYTGIFISSTGNIRTSSYVFAIDSSFALTWMRKFNNLPAAKIFQNGKYDNAYLLRYNAPVTNWLWDTAHLMHSWYSELPKDLGFLNAFFLRKVVYWKDLAETNDLYEYYKYNALDTWATANVWMQQMLTAPDWARHNYSLEFPLVFPCLLAEMTGIKRDMDKLLEARKEVDEKEAPALASLRKMIRAPAFNPGSPVQVKDLMKALGCGDLDSSNEKFIAKAQYRHPINERVLQLVLDIRGLRKLATTYLRLESDADKKGEKGSKEFEGRILYSLNPHGTDTGRLASKESAFWCGLNIQNIPVGEDDDPSYTKQTICADEGFYLAECDLEQAESRDLAHISGDEALIAAVTGPNDFHSVNASAFFGRPYDDIYDREKKKTKDKPLRNLAKRTNHGAGYNMGPDVMVDTMGLKLVWKAKELLKLTFTDPRKITDFLLNAFHNTYKAIKGKYYPSVITEVTTTKMVCSRAYHHTPYNLATYDPKEYISKGDWTRYTFKSPDKKKPDLNSLVAHCPQSLNSRTLNEAFLDVFYNVALPNPTTFRLHAQIHDSILFSYAHGHSYLTEKVKACMEIPVTVRDVSGTYRTFTVPAALKMGKPGNPSTYWSDTE